MTQDAHRLAQEAIIVAGGNVEEALLLMAERALWMQDQASPGYMRTNAVMKRKTGDAEGPPSIDDDWIGTPQTDE